MFYGSSDNFHFSLANMQYMIDLNDIKESADVKLRGFVIDNRLSFEKHIANYSKQCQTNVIHSGE